jgi:hypothetical protein
VDADLDTLATALYARTDDLLKGSPEQLRARPAVGIAPRISDAELVTLAVLQALLGFPSEARWLRFAHRRLRHLFAYLPQQPGYNKRLRRLAGTVSWLARGLARDTSVWTDDVWVVDSTPVECARSREAVRRWDLAGGAEYGCCASHSWYFCPLRLTADKNCYGQQFEADLSEAGSSGCAAPAAVTSADQPLRRPSSRSWARSQVSSTSNAMGGTLPTRGGARC